MLDFRPSRSHDRAAVPFDLEAQDWWFPGDIFHSVEELVSLHPAVIAGKPDPGGGEKLFHGGNVGDGTGWQAHTVAIKLEFSFWFIEFV